MNFLGTEPGDIVYEVRHYRDGSSVYHFIFVRSKTKEYIIGHPVMVSDEKLEWYEAHDMPKEDWNVRYGNFPSADITAMESAIKVIFGDRK
jgi:hypothetical protein